MMCLKMNSYLCIKSFVQAGLLFKCKLLLQDLGRVQTNGLLADLAQSLGEQGPYSMSMRDVFLTFVLHWGHSHCLIIMRMVGVDYLHRWVQKLDRGTSSHAQSWMNLRTLWSFSAGRGKYTRWSLWIEELTLRNCILDTAEFRDCVQFGAQGFRESGVGAVAFWFDTYLEEERKQGLRIRNSYP